MIVSPFAGPGGWCAGAASLGLRPVGIEWEAAECATRAAAGHLTIRADVSTYPVEAMAGRVEGLTMSPPCPDFSSAGKRAGLAGETGPLVFEVLRWAEGVRPRWLVCENVKEVAAIWRSFRAPLAAMGYSVWTGVLDAADYGVPQNRKRAFLLASLDRQVGPPAPTHSKTGADEMFGGGRAKWISMAEALWWDEDRRIVETQNGSAAATDNFTGPRVAGVIRKYEREIERPAPTMTSRGDLWKWVVDVGQDSKVAGGGKERYVRSIERPSPTVDGKAGTRWKLHRPGRTYGTTTTTTTDEPAPCVALGHNVAEWCWERPATTVQTTPRVAPPGHHERQWRDAVPVELWELGVLQGFPADYAVPPPMAAHLLAAVTGRALVGVAA